MRTRRARIGAAGLQQPRGFGRAVEEATDTGGDDHVVLDYRPVHNGSPHAHQHAVAHDDRARGPPAGQRRLPGAFSIPPALVVAADEGVMPQTREHLEICELLKVKQGIVILTKTDLVEDADWLAELVRVTTDELGPAKR